MTDTQHTERERIEYEAMRAQERERFSAGLEAWDRLENEKDYWKREAAILQGKLDEAHHINGKLQNAMTQLRSAASLREAADRTAAAATEHAPRRLPPIPDVAGEVLETAAQIAQRHAPNINGMHEDRRVPRAVA